MKFPYKSLFLLPLTTDDDCFYTFEGFDDKICEICMGFMAKSANFHKNLQINDQSTLNHKKKTINDNHKIIKK